MPVKAMINKSKGTRKISKKSAKLLQYMGFGKFDHKLQQAVLYCNTKDGKMNMWIDDRGEAYTTSTCNCCGKYTPGIGRSKLFVCKDKTCDGHKGVIRDGQGAINILSQALFDEKKIQDASKHTGTSRKKGRTSNTQTQSRSITPVNSREGIQSGVET
jgi:transposase